MFCMPQNSLQPLSGQAAVAMSGPVGILRRCHCLSTNAGAEGATREFDATQPSFNPNQSTCEAASPAAALQHFGGREIKFRSTASLNLPTSYADHYPPKVRGDSRRPAPSAQPLHLPPACQACYTHHHLQVVHNHLSRSLPQQMDPWPTAASSPVLSSAPGPGPALPNQLPSTDIFMPDSARDLQSPPAVRQHVSPLPTCGR